MSDNTYKSMFKSDFTFTPQRNLTRLQDDECEQQRRGSEDTTKLKYTTTNHLDLLEGHEYNWFGIGLRDHLFVPSDNMDGDSSLRYAPLTNCRVRDNYGQLPIPTLPSLHNAHAQDTDKESKMLWPLHDRGQKVCNPKDTEYFNRSFYIFPEEIRESGELKHSPIRSVQTTNDYRQGLSTRFIDLDKKQEQSEQEYEKSMTLRK
jgi:hypothetical protein